MKLFSKLLLVQTFFLFVGKVSAQNYASPYTNYGVGEFSEYLMPHNEMMGGVGIAMPSFYFMNIKNPAWLTYNNLVSFQVGLKSDARNYTTENQNISNSTASLRYLALSLPILPGKWTTAVSVLPFSSVNYRIENERIVENTLDEIVLQEFTGQGGLSQFAWANGIRLFGKLNVGIQGNFVFGNIRKRSDNIINPDSVVASDFRITYEDNSSHTGFNLGFSVGQRIAIGEENHVTYGAKYDLKTDLSGIQDVFLVRYNSTGALDFNRVPLEENVNITTEMPHQFSVGVGWEKLNKIQVGLDASYQNWSKISTNSAISLRDVLNIGIGLSYIPDVKSVNSYFERINYRAGLQLKQLPYQINGRDINEFGINFGASFPVSGLSSVDTGVKFGWRGTSEDQLVRETFVQFVFGLTINDRWFVKRKYD